MRPASGALEAGDHSQAGGLARSGRPQQGEELVGADLEVHPVHGDHVLVDLPGAGETHGNVLRHALLYTLAQVDARNAGRFAPPWPSRRARLRAAQPISYGFKLHAAVCASTGLPLAWQVETARDAEQTHAPALLDVLHARGFRPETCAMDSGYDVGPVHDAFEAKGCHPVVKLCQTHAVKRGDHKPPRCEHGKWRFAGSEYSRKACHPASRWVKAAAPVA